MPKIKKFKPIEQEQLEEELRSRYGGMMDAKHVGVELSLNHFNSYTEWLADVPYVKVGKRKKWRVADVAEKIYRCTEKPDQKGA